MSQSAPPFQTRAAAAAATPPMTPPSAPATSTASAAPPSARATAAVPPPLAAPAAPAPSAAAPQTAAPPASHLDSILRIPVIVQVFLGAASMPIADLMKLGRGAVVALDHDIGDPVDVVVNGRVIARGELVALEEDPSKIGVKLTEIVGNPDSA